MIFTEYFKKHGWLGQLFLRIITPFLLLVIAPAPVASENLLNSAPPGFGLEVTYETEKQAVVLVLPAPAAASVNHNKLANPTRVFLDIGPFPYRKAASLPLKPNPLAKAIRIGVHEQNIRIVVDLLGGITPDYSVKREPGRIRVEIRKSDALEVRATPPLVLPPSLQQSPAPTKAPAAVIPSPATTVPSTPVPKSVTLPSGTSTLTPTVTPTVSPSPNFAPVPGTPAPTQSPSPTPLPSTPPPTKNPTASPTPKLAPATSVPTASPSATPIVAMPTPSLAPNVEPLAQESTRPVLVGRPSGSSPLFSSTPSSRAPKKGGVKLNKDPFRLDDLLKFSLDKVFINFQSGVRPIQDISITNRSEYPLFITATPKRLDNAGLDTEASEETSNLVVSPRNISLLPGEQKSVRLVLRQKEGRGEQVYRVHFVPQAEAFDEEIKAKIGERETRLNVVTGIAVTVTSAPWYVHDSVTFRRDGGVVSIRNEGNVTVHLESGKLCLPATKDCYGLPIKRLYPGNQWDIKAAPDARLEFLKKYNDDYQPLIIPVS